MTDVALDQRMKRLQGRCAGADLVGQRRHAQIDAFAPVAFALAVQRLMLANAAAVFAALVLRKKLRDKPPMLDDTLAELAKDRDNLKSRM